MATEKARIKDMELKAASAEGMDAFVDVFVRHTLAMVGGELTAETMARLSADQITLLAYNILRDEVMSGGRRTQCTVHAEAQCRPDNALGVLHPP